MSSDWRFDVDEVGDDEEPYETVEPGSPSLENALFVLVGALGTVAVIALLVLG